MDKHIAIQAALLRQMLASSKITIITSTLLAAILAYIQHEVIASTAVLVWLILIVLVAILRAALADAYLRSPPTEQSSLRARLTTFRIGVLAIGVMWGSAGIVMFPPHDPPHQMFLIFMLAGLTAGGVVSYSADLFSGICFAVAALTPAVVRLFIAEENLSIAMGMAGTLYLGFMLMSIRHINRNIRENIVLHLEASEREETVRISEERYRLLLKHSPVGIIHYDTNLVITYCNDRFASIMHNSAERLIGLDMKSLRDQSVMPALKKALEGEIGYYEGHYTATLSDTDGWFAMTCATSRDAAGQIAGGVAILQDVTERKHAETALHESHQKMYSLLNSMAEGAYGLDLNGNCTFVNRSFMRILGYEHEDEVIGKHIHALIHHAHPDGSPYPASECKMHNAYRSREIHVLSEVFWHKNGSAIPIEYWSRPIIVDGIVQGAIATFLDLTERNLAEAQIRNLAFYDTLTQLPNRRLLNDRMGQALAASKRSGRYGALMLLDLDNFKPLNDTFGHDVGDLLLIEVARRISGCIRETDTVARFGGDEYVVVLSELDIDKVESTRNADIVAEKIRASLAEPYLLTVRQNGSAGSTVEYHCTASIGVVLFNYHASREEILKQADIAMYRAKASGRNRVSFDDQST
ncbi:hypothetical protein FGKAn22_16410 [Ferrigenium kumadai]|uniref:Diguanylate cyclase n=1 Tax=Ferrigenium kumadai TaxID=1682490 RepID=A0AAN1VZZ3_9PROT|nr:diguanylate cyclase [Ferrigenium kumadai]BBI99948.1 hypothetical protein FGKAn22_16410 [Ferrigenium kumadai]